MTKIKAPKETGLSDELVTLLSAADTRNGLEPGTMFAVMQQEVGGQREKFLTDPTAYHYGLNKDGRRIAAHTGKISTAFGPFGILESTAAKPGFGVAPLKDKSLAEQVRFASDYYKARGADAYGEGKVYGDQVRGRIAGGNPTAMARAAVPVSPIAAVAQAPVQLPVQAAVQEPTQVQAQVQAPVPVDVPQQVAQPQAPDEWQEFLARSQAAGIRPADLAYGGPAKVGPGIVVPDFAAAAAYGNQPMQPNFAALRPMRARV